MIRKIKTVLKVTLLVALTQIVNAQEKKSLDLKVGDILPDITFKNLIHYKSPDAKLSDFKGKLVIFDFWSTTCDGCIKSFPKLDAMQTKFKKDVQIILVNTAKFKDTPEKVSRTFALFKKNSGYESTLPCLVADTVMDSYISYRYIPHYVFVDGNRKIIAITTWEDVTEENITAMIQNKKVELTYKYDDQSFDPFKPLFIDNNGDPGNGIIQRSTLAKYSIGLGYYGGYLEAYKESSLRYSAINQLLLTIFNDAFKLFAIPENRWIFETSRSELFAKTEAKGRKHTYCYELIAETNSDKEFEAIMRKDLSHIFEIDVIKELRLKDVYIMSMKNGIKKNTDFEANGIHAKTKDLTVKAIIKILNKRFDNTPFIYDGDDSSVLTIPKSFESWTEAEALKKLTDLGFSARREQRKIEVLVFKDIK